MIWHKVERVPPETGSTLVFGFCIVFRQLFIFVLNEQDALQQHIIELYGLFDFLLRRETFPAVLIFQEDDMENEEGFWALLEDIFSAWFVLFLLFWVFIAVAAMAYLLLKWMWQLFEWSVSTQSNFRWVILLPILLVAAPFWLVWLALKEGWFQLVRLFLRGLIAGRRLLY